jgi:hypothetical protein
MTAAKFKTLMLSMSRFDLSYTTNMFIRMVLYNFGPMKSQSYVTTDAQPASLSWNKAPIWSLRPDLYYLCDSYGLAFVGRPL